MKDNLSKQEKFLVVAAMLAIALIALGVSLIMSPGWGLVAMGIALFGACAASNEKLEARMEEGSQVEELKAQVEGLQKEVDLMNTRLCPEGGTCAHECPIFNCVLRKDPP